MSFLRGLMRESMELRAQEALEKKESKETDYVVNFQVICLICGLDRAVFRKLPLTERKRLELRFNGLRCVRSAQIPQCMLWQKF